MRQSKDISILAGQQGQASVFVLAMLGVVILITVFLYQSGRLTSEKMQIQNGADAAAFGASVLEARSLNFAAYTNRAMVANEVAVGQLVGLLSFADELKTSRKYAEVYAIILDAIGTALSASVVLAPAGAPIIAIGEGIATIGNVLGTVGDTLQSFFKKIIPPAIKVLSIINRAYSTSQKIYQGATYALILKYVDQSLQDNVALASDEKGPTLSPFGFVAMLGHIPSSWSGYTRIYSAADDDKKSQGMQRLAATVRANRDGFSSGDPHDKTNRNWNFDLVRDFRIVKFSYGADSVGASELRATDKSYAWTAADGLVFEAKLKVSVKIPLTKKSIHESWGWNLPFGTGGFQAIETDAEKLQLLDILPSTPKSIYGPRDQEVYGGAGNSGHLTAWPGIMAEMSGNTVAKYDGGLHSYRDSDEGYKPLFSFSAPYFLVGVTKPLKDLKKQGPKFSDHYDLYEYTASGSDQSNTIGAIAKSELYFARPTVEQVEKPNVFRPYWQARLVETSNSERFLALAIQQETVWLTADEADLIGGESKILSDIMNVLAKVQQAIGKISKAISWLF